MSQDDHAPVVPERSAFVAYEAEKRRLQALLLTPDQYEEEVLALAERLGI
jgi:hypothetical protein